MRCSSSLSYTLLPIMSSKSDVVERYVEIANPPKFLQHRERQNPPRNCYPASLYPGRWNHRPCHAPMHDAYVYNFPPSHPTAVFRDILVHAPPVHSLPAGPLHACNWLLCARHSRTNFAICGKEVLEPLHWLPRLEVGTGRGQSLPHGEALPRDSIQTGHRHHKGDPSSIW